VWPLTSLLTVAFAWKVAVAMPSIAASAVVWALAVGALRPWIGMGVGGGIHGSADGRARSTGVGTVGTFFGHQSLNKNRRRYSLHMRGRSAAKG
jgi:hypothetical protein